MVADWAQCKWLHDNISNVTTSPMQHVIATELQQLGACQQQVNLHQPSHVLSIFYWRYCNLYYPSFYLMYLPHNISPYDKLVRVFETVSNRLVGKGLSLPFS